MSHDPKQLDGIREVFSMFREAKAPDAPRWYEPALGDKSFWTIERRDLDANHSYIAATRKPPVTHYRIFQRPGTWWTPHFDEATKFNVSAAHQIKADYEANDPVCEVCEHVWIDPNQSPTVREGAGHG